jgi:hypothetical protein
MTDTGPAITEGTSRGNMKRDHFREMPKGPPPALQPKPTLTDAERDAIYDGLYCLNIFCNARQSGDALAVKLRGAAETLRSLLERLAGYTA